MAKKLTTSEVIARFTEVHGTKYDYSKFINSGHTKKGIIICSEHGEFEQSPKHHYLSGCAKCAGNKRLTRDIFVEKVTELYGDMYDCSLVPETLPITRNMVTMVCREHGEFDIRISSLLAGNRCSECANIASRISKRKPIKTFVEQVQMLHPNICTDTKIDYINKSTKIKFTCNVHNTTFMQSPESLLKGNIGCKKCTTAGVSIREQEVYEFIKSILPNDTEIVTNDRSTISPKELDVLIPSMNIAFEFDGIRWHNEGHNGTKHSHKHKQDACNEVGIRLIQIFEDEWVDKRSIVEGKIKYLLGCDDRNRIYARKTQVREVTKQDKKDFLNNNHIQGNCKSSYDIGLFSDDVLVAVMSFAFNSVSNEHLLTRYATSENVIGGFTKLLSYFKKSCEWATLISFADCRWSDGSVYSQSGWVLDKVLAPDYQYVDGAKRVHKFNYRRQQLSTKLGERFDESKSEYQNTFDNGIYRIWDSGKLRYSITNKALK